MSQNTDSFSHIRTGTLRGDLPIDFDVYLQVAGKFILYCKQGENFEGERLERLKRKNIERLFVHSDQAQNYQNYLNKNIDRAFNTSASLSLTQRAEIIQGYVEAATQDLLQEPHEKPYYKVLKKAVINLQDFLLNDKNALAALLSIKNTHRAVAQHSVNVAALAIEMCHDLDIPRGEARDCIALGALLHDLDHETNRLSLDKDLSNYSPAERDLYIWHSHRGADRLLTAGFYELEVIDIVQNHHELVDGSGYPDKKTEKKLTFSSQIVGTANAFERLISFQQLSIKDALKKFLIEAMGLHSLPVLQALQRVLKSNQLI